MKNVSILISICVILFMVFSCSAPSTKISDNKNNANSTAAGNFSQNLQLSTTANTVITSDPNLSLFDVTSLALDMSGLLKIKAMYKDGTYASDAAIKGTVDNIIAEANYGLTRNTFSVTHKTLIPPSKNTHDYMSMGIYYWPDPNNPKGPYINKDGQINPESNSSKYSKSEFALMGYYVWIETLAYLLTDNVSYANRAVTFVKAWFLDSATKMNPNMNYAQSIPQSSTTGRKEGVLDTSITINVIESAKILNSKGIFTSSDLSSLKSWFTSYISWMQTSTYGKGENAATNNHGEWFDAQIMEYADFVGNSSLVKSVAKAAPSKRFSPQINSSTGELAQETARTRPIHYEMFALEAFTLIAIISDRYGATNIWTSTKLGLAYDFYVSYYNKNKNSGEDLVDEPVMMSIFKYGCKKLGKSYYSTADAIIGSDYITNETAVVTPSFDFK